MTPKQIEKLARAAWGVALAATPEEEQELVGVLRQTLHGVDPRGVYQGNSVPEELAQRRAEEPYVSLRDSPRLPKLIGENEAGFHE
jgi:hypothetical protein